MKLRAIAVTQLLGVGLILTAAAPWTGFSRDSRASLLVTGVGILTAPTGKLEKALDDNDVVVFGQKKDAKQP